MPMDDLPRPGPAEAAREPTPDDGVDVTLIRWTLSLAPRERLALLQANAEALARLQDAAAARR
jgi:hypothetical protein